jgi:hypothetical protein
MGQDRATSFIEAVHWPNDDEQKKRWMHDYGWHPPDHWDEPMLPRDHFEASCRKCHANQVRVPQGEKIDRAQTLIERYGCYGCHKIAGYESLPKPAPDLRSIAPRWTGVGHEVAEGRAAGRRRRCRSSGISSSDPVPEAATSRRTLVAFLFEKSKHETHPGRSRGRRAEGPRRPGRLQGLPLRGRDDPPDRRAARRSDDQSAAS